MNIFSFTDSVIQTRIGKNLKRLGLSQNTKLRIRMIDIVKAKALLCFFAILVASGSAFSQSMRTDDGIKHWEGSFSAGLNSAGYQFDFGIAYFPLQYVGVKARVGFAAEIEEFGDWLRDEYDYGYDYENKYATRFKFTPSLVLRSPRLIHWKSQDAGFYLFAEPGIVLSPGAHGSKNAECFNWDFRCGVNLQIDRFIVTIGYGISNFNLYSGYPTNHWGSPLRDDTLTHSGFLAGAYKF